MDSLHFISPVEFFFSLGSGRVSAGKIDILVIMQTAARLFHPCRVRVGSLCAVREGRWAGEWNGNWRLRAIKSTI